MVERDVELTGLNSYCVSARADLCLFPENDDDLLEVIQRFPSPIPNILGFGTNVILRSKTYEAPIIVLSGLNRWIKRVGSNLLHVGAGARLGAVVEYANRAGLAGLQSLAGVPGSTGGAIRMNAGAYGQCIGERVRSVTTLDSITGNYKQWDKASAKFSYRNSVFSDPGAIITDALIELEGNNIDNPWKIEELRRESLAVLAKRATRIPYGLPNAGSVFKRCEGCSPVGELIEQLGLKGYRINDAMVSYQHAGIFVNSGFATGDDIINLIADVTSKVHNRFGVTLEQEQVIL
ncbi:MAG: UDP-N-acetylmuramate dehydrogenase [Alcaligenaceae bacterium]|nr:MAG: UDP-N-acetylmuramate dehydrogenase [Alcaligenaceae bacterium]